MDQQRLSNLTDSPTITIDNVQISQVVTAKSLGVTIENKLDWSSHIDKLSNKESRLRHWRDKAHKALCFSSYLAPNFPSYNSASFCNVVWGNCGIPLQNKVQKLQYRGARVLTYSKYDADAGYLFEFLGWRNLSCQQQIQRATMVGLAPEYLCSKFERRHTH